MSSLLVALAAALYPAALEATEWSLWCPSWCRLRRCDTFTGSIVAMAKLQGWLSTPAWMQTSAPCGEHRPGGGLSDRCDRDAAECGLRHRSLAAGGDLRPLGIGVTLPIGGADMPVVISLLNSYSGVAAAAAGFVVGSRLLIVAGAMVEPPA